MAYARATNPGRSYSPLLGDAVAEPRPAEETRKAPPATRYTPEPRPILTELRRGELGSEVRPRRLEQREEWTWDGWGRRSEQHWVRVSRNLEMVNWGAIGAMVGAGLAAVPAVYPGVTNYPLFLTQPLGAALGAVTGNLASWWHWRRESKKYLSQ